MYRGVCTRGLDGNFFVCFCVQEENHDGAEGMEPPCGAEVVIETEDKVVFCLLSVHH